MGSAARSRALLALLGLLLACGVGELALRVVRPRAVGIVHQPPIYRPDDRLGYRYQPGARGWMHREFEIDAEVATNALGFHDVEVEPGKRAWRIVVVGDSFTAGLHVPLAETWTRRLEADLRRRGDDPRLEVVNLGVDGTGTDYQLAVLREHAPRLEPDVVLLAFFENDLDDVAGGPTRRESYRGYVLASATSQERDALRREVDAHLERTALRWLHRNVYLARLAAAALGPRPRLFRSNFVRSGRRASAEPPASILAPSFREFLELSRELDFVPLVVAVPSRDDPERSARILQAASLPAELPVIDPVPALRTAVAERGLRWRDLYWRRDGHWNATGHDAFARALAHEDRLHASGGDCAERSARTVPIRDPGLLEPPPTFEPPGPFTLADGMPEIEFALYPVPFYEERDPNWGHWGTGAVHSNGRIYVAVGDHLQVEGNAHLYEYDPERGRLRCLAGLRESVANGAATQFGFAKVHGRIDEGRDGRLYFSSWGGDRRDHPAYEGGHLFVWDPARETLSDLGIPLPGWGTPSTRLDPASMLLYAEYQHGRRREADFVVYDLAARRIVFRGGHDGMFKARDFFLDRAGNAYWNGGDGRLETWERATGAHGIFPARMPGTSQIRRAVGPDPEGRYYGVNEWEHVLFRLDPERRTISEIGELWTPVAAMALDPGGRFLYYVAGSNVADGEGTQLVRVDLARDAAQEVVAFLDAVIERDRGFRIGHPKSSGFSPSDSYDLRLAPDRRTLYVNLNGTLVPNGFRRVALLVVRLPGAPP